VVTKTARLRQNSNSSWLQKAATANNSICSNSKRWQKSRNLNQLLQNSNNQPAATKEQQK